MQIDEELVKKVGADLTEMLLAVDKKELDKDVAVDKLNNIIKNLDELNTLNLKAIEEYKNQKKEWQSKSEKFDDSLNDILTLNVDKESIQKHLQNITLDSKLIAKLLAHDLQVEYAQWRKKWLWKNKIVFKKLNLISKLLAISISFTFGFIFEKIGEALFPKTPDYLIGISVAIISFFSIEKYIDKAASDYFWNEAKLETYILSVHFEVYCKHTIAIFEFLMKANQI